MAMALDRPKLDHHVVEKEKNEKKKPSSQLA
jgi:hypothetical protein